MIYVLYFIQKAAKINIFLVIPCQSNTIAQHNLHFKNGIIYDFFSLQIPVNLSKVKNRIIVPKQCDTKEQFMIKLTTHKNGCLQDMQSFLMVFPEAGCSKG